MNIILRVSSGIISGFLANVFFDSLKYVLLSAVVCGVIIGLIISWFEENVTIIHHEQ